MADEPLHCATHPGVRAAWECDGCRRRLCPECAEAVEVGRGVTVVSCCACGGSAQPLTVPGADEPFPSSVRHLLSVPVGALGLGVLGVLAAVAGWLAEDGTRARWLLVAWCVPAACIAVAIVRATAERPAPGEPSVRVAIGSGLLWPGLRLAVLGIPALLLAPLLGTTGRLGLALGVGAVAPLVLARVAAGASLLSIVDPRWHWRAARALGRDALLAQLLSAFVVSAAAWLWAAAGEGAGEVPALWGRVAGTVAALGLLLVPQLAGLLVRAHAEALGVELQTRGRRLAWPGAVPRSSRGLGPPSQT